MVSVAFSCAAPPAPAPVCPRVATIWDPPPIARVARPRVLEDEGMSTIAEVPRLWSARYTSDYLTGLHTIKDDPTWGMKEGDAPPPRPPTPGMPSMTEIGADMLSSALGVSNPLRSTQTFGLPPIDDCRSTPIAKMRFQLDLSSLREDPNAAIDKLKDKAKAVGKRVSNAWNRRPQDVDSEAQKEKENREILGYPIKDRSDDVRLVLEGRAPRGWLSEEEENSTCDCIAGGAFKSEHGMCKASVYRTKRRHRVWQVRRSLDGATPVYPFDKFWHPFEMRIPSPNLEPDEAYFTCDIPANTLIAVGIAQNPRWKPRIVTTPGQIVADPSAAAAGYVDQKVEDAKREIGNKAADAASIIIGEQAGYNERFLTMWYIHETAGLWGSEQPPAHWNCKVVQMLCVPIVGCTPKPDISNALLGPGAPPIPGGF